MVKLHGHFRWAYLLTLKLPQFSWKWTTKTVYAEKEPGGYEKDGMFSFCVLTFANKSLKVQLRAMGIALEIYMCVYENNSFFLAKKETPFQMKHTQMQSLATLLGTPC